MTHFDNVYDGTMDVEFAIVELILHQRYHVEPGHLKECKECCDNSMPVAYVSLEELVDLTERHEEGHLCDRTRFYPPGAGLWTLFTDVVLRGLVAGGQEGVMSELEYRAQLIALCVAEDPRVGLVELLAAADGNFAGGTPHGPAYVRLLEDLLETLDDLRVGEPGAWSALNPSRLYVHDLHRLDAEQVRSASIVLARQRGLVLEGWGEEDR